MFNRYLAGVLCATLGLFLASAHLFNFNHEPNSAAKLQIASVPGSSIPDPWLELASVPGPPIPDPWFELASVPGPPIPDPWLELASVPGPPIPDPWFDSSTILLKRA